MFHLIRLKTNLICLIFLSFSLTIEVKTTRKYSVPGSGIFFVVIIFGCIGNSSLVIRNENIFVLILSIFFDFCPCTISGGNEQVSHQDEVLFYLSVELSTHSLCLHGNKQNHLLELWRNLELMQQTPSWFISKTQWKLEVLKCFHDVEDIPVIFDTESTSVSEVMYDFKNNRYIPTYKHPYSSCVAKQEPEGMLCSPKSILDNVTLGDW